MLAAQLRQAGVILLMKCILDMPSYTYAVKAQRMLRARGYPCIIKRRGKESENGCGFSLHINGSCDRAAELLDAYSVPYTVRKGGDVEDDKL